MNDVERNCIETQLAELELLMSMYSNEGELEFDDISELADLRVAVDSSNPRIHASGVGFTLHLSILQHKVQVSCRLPHSYPESPPMLCVRSDRLSSTQHHRLNSSLQEFVSKHNSDGVSRGILNEIIQWTTENFPHYVDQSDDGSFKSGETSKSVAQQAKRFFSRLWIYSHHIYNREKRRTIIDEARELDLTGFSAPGKPGIICVEGQKPNADKFWQQIRSLQWQRITLAHHEDYELSTDVNSLRRFENFEEKCFVNPHATSGHGTHLDRGQLLQFLQQNGCKDVFRYYFGIDGKEDSLLDKQFSTD